VLFFVFLRLCSAAADPVSPLRAVPSPFSSMAVLLLLQTAAWSNFSPVRLPGSVRECFTSPTWLMSWIGLFLESRRQLANNNLVAMIPSPITLARNGTGRLNQKIHTHITRESNRPQVWTTISPRSVLMNCLVNCPPLQKNKKNTETHVGSYSIHDFWASLFILSNGLPSQ
jgi:hypothetical protein